MNRDYFLVVIVTIMSLCANIPVEFVSPVDLDRKYLIVGLMIVVTIALVRYSRFMMVLTIVILAVGANLPQDIAIMLNVDSKYLMFALVAVVLVSLSNRVLKLPTGLEAKQNSNLGTRALFLAVKKQRTSLVRTILDSGSNIDARLGNGSTALMLAAAKDDHETVRLLLEREQILHQ